VILFLSFVDNSYSRSSSLYRALEKSGEEVSFLLVPSNLFMMVAKLMKFRVQIRGADLTIVMSPCHKIVPLVRIFSKKVVLDAGWPLSDSNFTRGRRRISFVRPLINLLIDFISMHSANLVVLESELQKWRVSKKFFLSNNKLTFRFSGICEENFLNDDQVLPSEISELNLSGKKVVFFRGKNNIESGVEILAATSWVLSDKILLIVVSDKPVKSGFNPRNTIVIARYLQYSELAAIYRISEIAIGQISEHERLNWTIPHKAFEAAFFSTPYLSRKNPGVLEFLDTKSAIYLDEVTKSSLAIKIDELMSNPESLSEYSKNARNSYTEKAGYAALVEQYKMGVENFSTD